jgi:hypothetical protein
MPCPLCRIADQINGIGVTDQEEDNRCRGCPIDDLTGKGCHGTPYIVWAKVERSNDPETKVLARYAARRQVSMIIALQNGDFAAARSYLI